MTDNRWARTHTKRHKTNWTSGNFTELAIETAVETKTETETEIEIKSSIVEGC